MDKDALVSFATALVAAANRRGVRLDLGVFVYAMLEPEPAVHLFVSSPDLALRDPVAVRSAIDAAVAAVRPASGPVPGVSVVPVGDATVREFSDRFPDARDPEMRWYESPPSSFNALNEAAVLTGVAGWIFPAWRMPGTH